MVANIGAVQIKRMLAQPGLASHAFEQISGCLDTAIDSHGLIFVRLVKETGIVLRGAIIDEHKCALFSSSFNEQSRN